MSTRKPREYVSAGWIADAIGVSHQSFTGWHTRGYPGMPEPAAVLRHPKTVELMWLPEDAEKWKRWLASRSEPEYKVLLAEQRLARLRTRVAKRGE